MSDSAARHLSRVDPILRAIIRTHGPGRIEPQTLHSPYEALVRAIAYQQLNGKAAETILQRFVALFPEQRFPHPQGVLAVEDEVMRRSGLSRQKIAAIRDIAANTLSGVVPTRRAALRMDDDALIERLTTIRGVGRWTVEMLLIFNLNRPDVLPIDDYGVRAGFKIAYRRRELPAPKQLRSFGERWAPYRSTAAWYLWRVVERAKATVAD